MKSLAEILTQAKIAGASDVHFTVGLPPKMRVNGDLINMEGDKLLPPDTAALVEEVMNDKQKEIFAERGEYDMSFPLEIWAVTV